MFLFSRRAPRAGSETLGAGSGLRAVVWRPLRFSYITSRYLSIIYFLRLIPQVGENGAAREPCQKAYVGRRPTPKAEGLRRRLAGGRSPQRGREGGREGGDSRECCCQSPVRGEGLRRRPKACRRAKSRGREGIAGERE